MSLGLIKPGMRSANLTGKLHPMTGLSIEPIGVLKNGTVLWPVIGAAEPSDDPDDPSYTGEDDADDDEDDDEDEEDTKKPPVKKTKKASKKADDDDEDEEDDEDRQPTRPERQAARYRVKLREAEKKNADLEARLRAIEDKDKPADEVKAREAKEATDRAEKAAGVARRLQLENAFLRSNDVNWIDPTDAFRLIDLDDVDVDEDGTVDESQLRRALRALAKKKPHLVKAKSSARDNDDDQDDEEPRSRRSASTMNSSRKGQGKTPDRSVLAKKFPVLNNL